MDNILLFCIVGLNIVTLIVYGNDKLKAKKGKWRIAESTLLLLVIVGGSVGAWCGIKVLHHKTKHKKFKYGVPFIIAMQIGFCLYLMAK